MNSTSVSEYIEHLLSLDLPFAVYRKPEETEINAIAQENDVLHYATSFKESGFVFSPFDAIDKSVLIPGTQLQSLKMDTLFEFRDSELLIPETNNEERRRHIEMVEQAVTHIAQSDLRKVVLSRKQTMECKASVAEIVLRLLVSYPTAFVYCWYHPKIGLWLGATPETLLLIANNRLHTMSLAGTLPFKGTLHVEWGEKEIEEQQMVTDTIVNRLQPIISELSVSEVGTKRAGALIHLLTTISGMVDMYEVSLKAIIDALHPTPAVCGLPQNMAKESIALLEDYDRAYYTGFLGEINMPREVKRARTRRNVEHLQFAAVKKSTHLFVNLRCMQFKEDKAQVYVGGGITESSIPEDEWEETVNKLSTMGKVLI